MSSSLYAHVARPGCKNINVLRLAIFVMNARCAEYVKEAVAEDNAGNYQRAFELYKIALEYFGTHLKYEKNARARETITAKVGLSSTHAPLYIGSDWQ